MRLRNILWYGSPAMLGLILYWQGIFSWFQKDDFAWLGLERRDLLGYAAQGTIRLVSERLYFWGLHALFGMNALPFHLVGFGTFAADTVLISLVCARVSGSRNAGLIAAMLWTVNSVMAYSMSWVALYNQLAIALVFLTGLWFLLNGHYLWQLFVLGFGVLEINVVYPAIAALWSPLRRLVPMFAGSVAFILLRFATAPAATGAYAIHFDSRMLSTLWTYWKIALGPSRLFLLGVYPSFGRSMITFALTAALLGVLIRDLTVRRYTTAKFAAWFVLVLAPVLPLPDHIQDYYLTAAMVGLAMWAGDGLVRAPRWLAIPLVALYAAVALPLGQHVTHEFAERSSRVHRIIDEIVADQRAHPSASIVIDGVDDDLWTSAFEHRPLRLYGFDIVVVRGRGTEPLGARVYTIRP